MFKCNNCSKTYTSNRRYDSHVERCEKQEATTEESLSTARSTRSSRSGRSMVSRRSTIPISDVELDTSHMGNDEYYKAMEKLSRDKTKLKEQLKKYSIELKRRVSGHRSEMVHYQDQIDTLTEERDYFQNEIERAKEDSGDSRVVKRLESTIMKLQERLSQQSKDGDGNKEILQQQIARLEEALKEKNENVQKLVMRLQQEHNAVQSVKDAYKTDKNKFEELHVKEKQEEINKILAEKHKTVTALGEKCKDLFAKLEVERKNVSDREAKIKEISSSLTQEKNNLKTALTESLESERAIMEGQINSVKTICGREVDELKESHSAEVERLTTIETNKLKRVASQLQHEISQRKKRIEELENESTEKEEQYKKFIEEKKAEFDNNTEKIKRAFRQRENEFKAQIDAVKIQTSTIIEETSRKLGEVTDECEPLRQELMRYKTATERMRENNKIANAQFVTNLNKQNDTHKLVVKEREDKITELESAIAMIRKESLQRVSNTHLEVVNVKNQMVMLHEEKVKVEKMVVEKEKEITTLNQKFTALKQRATSSNQELVTTLKNEADKCKKVQDQLLDNMRVCKGLEMERDVQKKETNVWKTQFALVKTEMKEKDDKIGNLEKERVSLTTERDSKTTELSTLKFNMQTLHRQLQAIKHETGIVHKKEIEELTAQINAGKTKISELEAADTKLREDYRTKLQQMLSSSDAKVQDVQNQLEKKIGEHATVKNNLEKTRANSTTIITRTKVTINQQQQELAKLKNELRDKENEITNIAVKIEKMKSDVTNAVQKLKYELSTQTALVKKRDDENAKLQSDKTNSDKILQKLTLEINTLKSNFSQTMNKETSELVEKEKKFAETLKEKDNEIKTLKGHVAAIIQEVKAQKQQLSEREKKVEDYVKNLKETPPNPQIDISMKRSRDEALIKMRKQKAEIERLEEENIKMRDGIDNAKTLLTAKNSELDTMSKTHGEIKQSFIQNLNQQAATHKAEMEKKDARVHELEQLMMSKIRLADADRE